MIQVLNKAQRREHSKLCDQSCNADSMYLKHLLQTAVIVSLPFHTIAAPHFSALKSSGNDSAIEAKHYNTALTHQIHDTNSEKIHTKRMLVFGDSLSDIGNVQLLLETLNGQQSLDFFFKPLNEDQRLRKLLTYLHISIEHLEDFEGDVTFFLKYLLAHINKIPIYPDDKYYSGTENNKGFGRFSNGPVWSEWLGKAILKDNVRDEKYYINRAYGGSWASKLGDQKIDWTLNIHALVKTVVDFIDGKLIPPDMHNLLDAFFLEYPESKGGEVIAVLYGANDYMNNNYSKAESKSNPRAHPETVVNDIISGVVKLADWASAMPEHSPLSIIYVSNLPDMSITPRYREKQEKSQDLYVLKDIKTHNELLQEQVKNLQKNPAYHSKVLIRYVDLFTPFQDIYQTSSMPDKQTACYPIDLLGGSSTDSTPPVPCKNPDDYFFWDAMHPTRQVHAEVGYRICKTLYQDIADLECTPPDWKNESSYPLPAFNP